MTDPIVACSPPSSQVGNTVLGFLLQALSWLCFGFFFGLGFYLAQIAGRHVAQ